MPESNMLIRPLNAAGLIAALTLAMAGCGPHQPVRTVAEKPHTAIRYHLPSTLAGEQSLYAARVGRALDDVYSFFDSIGFTDTEADLVISVVVIDWSKEGRRRLEASLGISPEDVPETFSGTVVGDTLYLVDPERYRAIWTQLYADEPWHENNYDQLVAHELAHKAHETVAMARFGSAEAMGPVWFFEGLAIMCAGQFDTDQRLMTWNEVMIHVGEGRTPDVSYPLYGKLVRSLEKYYPLDVLMRRAHEPGFPENLSQER